MTEKAQRVRLASGCPYGAGIPVPALREGRQGCSQQSPYEGSDIVSMMVRSVEPWRRITAGIEARACAVTTAYLEHGPAPEAAS